MLAPPLCSLVCANFADAFFLIPWATNISPKVPTEHQSTFNMASTEANCGCGEFIRYSGDPPEEVRRDFDIRESLRYKNIFDIKGNTVTMDEILGEPDIPRKAISIAVFFRSLG